MHLPDCNPGAHDHDSNLAQFNASKKKELSEIEAFMHVLQDWVDEAKHELETPVAEEKPKWVPPKQ